MSLMGQAKLRRIANAFKISFLGVSSSATLACFPSVPTPPPTPTPNPPPPGAVECITGRTATFPAAGVDEDIFLVGDQTTSAQAGCINMTPTSPSQVHFAGNSAATTASFNLWNGAPHGILVPSSAVAKPRVIFAMEFTANPAVTFTGSTTDALFKLSLAFASPLPAATYHVGYCQENSTQNGCQSGTAVVDQTVSASGTSFSTNGLTSNTIPVGSTPYLLELYL
ncbi:MAG: hypothetical protein ACXVAO_19215 [Vulcanimicrobiaceae bacterium]